MKKNITTIMSYNHFYVLGLNLNKPKIPTPTMLSDRISTLLLHNISTLNKNTLISEKFKPNLFYKLAFSTSIEKALS